MKRIVTFCALCALLGCRVSDAPENEGIALSYSTSEQSKTDLLAQGDVVGVFAAIEGTENYFLENAKYIVGSDGRSLSTTPAVYYPDRKQAVAFTAYLPFGGTWSGAVGTFAVPADQSTVTALKQADLCWAAASSTPAKTAVPLQFEHQLARLLITTNTPTEKITIPNAFSGGTLDIKTGTFTNTLQSEVFTTGTELILPAQTVTRLILTVANIEYVFEGSIALEVAKTTSLSLTLNPTQKTATLSGSSTTNWIGSETQGNPTQAVSNILTIHWPNYVPQGATPDKVVLTINNTDYTVSGSIIHSGQSFTVPFASAALRYPYTITKIAFYRGASVVFPTCTQLLGATIYKSSASTLGIKDHANAVLINGIWWATGNLIADGANGCKIGAPTDYGLYFRQGSLLGWRGGVNGDGKGQGWPIVGVAVRPGGYVATPAFLTSPAYTTSAKASTAINHFLTYPMNVAGVGDPCRYYLGAIWQTPTADMWLSLLGEGASKTTMDATVVRVKNTTLIIPLTGQIREFNGGDWDPRGATILSYVSSSWAAAAYGYGVHFTPEGGWTVQNFGFQVNVVLALSARCVATL